MVTYEHITRLVVDTVKHELGQLREDLGDTVDSILFTDEASCVIDAGTQLVAAHHEYAGPGEHDRYIEAINAATGEYW